MTVCFMLMLKQTLHLIVLRTICHTCHDDTVLVVLTKVLERTTVFFCMCPMYVCVHLLPSKIG